MKIKNIGGLSSDELRGEVSRGGRLVYYPYIISLGLITFKKKSDLYLVRKNESSLKRSIPFLLISMVFGWWGIPMGPTLTVQSIKINKNGGKDITEEVMSILDGRALYKQMEEEKAHYQTQ